MNWQRMHRTATVALLRTLLIAVNTIFLVNGAILLFVGVVLQGQFFNLHQITPEMEPSAPYIIISLGVFIFAVGLFAIWCSMKNHIALLYIVNEKKKQTIYSCLLGIILIVEIFLTVGALTKRKAFERSFKKSAMKIMEQYPNETLSKHVDQLQSTLSCCGLDSYKDWFETTFGNQSSEVPQSCCKSLLNVNCDRVNLRSDSLPTDINVVGCYSTVLQLIKRHYPIVAGLLLTISLIPLLGIIIACALIQQLGKHRYEKLN